jgi:hypothetical protein
MGWSGSVIEAGDRRGECVEETVDLVFVVSALADRRLGETHLAHIAGRQLRLAVEAADGQLQEVVNRVLGVTALPSGRFVECGASDVFGGQASVAHGVRC